MAEVEREFEALYSGLHAYREPGRDDVRCQGDSTMLTAYLRGKACVVLCANEDGTVSYQIRDGQGTVTPISNLGRSDITGLQVALNALSI